MTEPFTDDLAPKDVVIAAEMAVLGAAVQSRAAAERAAETVRPEDYWKGAHRLIAEAVEALIEDGKTVSPVATLNELTERGNVMQVGAGPALAELIERYSTDVAYDAAIIAKDAARRRVMQTLATARQMVASPTFDPDEDVDKLKQSLDAATSRVGADQPPTIGELLLRRLDEIAETLKPEESLPPPWTDLAFYIPGLRPGQVVVVGARPSVGKSIVGLSFARYAAIDLKFPVLLLSLEMNRSEVTDRLIAAEAGVALDRIQAHTLDDADWERVARIQDRVQSAPLVVDDSPRCTLARVRARLRGMARTDPARLVVIDYLGLMDAPRADSRERQVAELSRGLKLLAMEFAVPIMALHQLNRESTKRSDKRPTMADLRESGAIEADADMVLLLHREDIIDKESPRAGELDVIVDKNRSGPTGVATLAYQGHYARAGGMAQEPRYGGLRRAP